MIGDWDSVEELSELVEHERARLRNSIERIHAYYNKGKGKDYQPAVEKEFSETLEQVDGWAHNNGGDYVVHLGFVADLNMREVYKLENDLW